MMTAPNHDPAVRPPADLGPESDFSRLFTAHCGGTLTHADADRLENMLADPRVRAAYREHMRLHAGLVRLWYSGGAGGTEESADRSLAPGRPSGAARGPAPRGPSRRSGRHAAMVATPRMMVASWLRFLSRPAAVSVLVATAFIGGVLISARAIRLDQIANANGSAQRPVAAHIAGVHEARWSDGQDWRPWQDIPAGGRIDLVSGLVQIAHHGGGVALIEGPASYRVLGPAAGRLAHGRIVVVTEHPDRPGPPDRDAQDLPPLFTVHTPRRLVHDLGTEFGVEVAEVGTACVRVFEGLVELAGVGSGAAAADPAVRLATGEAAGVDEMGRIVPAGVEARRFVRSIPAPKAEPPPSPEIPWDDATATIIYRDAFRGSGPLDGTTPASRGGVGAAAWRVSPPAWGRLESAGSAPGVHVSGGGHALLPFRPEPGRVYKLTVALDVTAGGGSGLAFGMRADIPSRQPLNMAVIGQRHQPGRGVPYFTSNTFSPGPGIDKRFLIDRSGGLQTRCVLLDTRGERWRVAAQLDGRTLASYEYPVNPVDIEQVGVEASPVADVGGRFLSFTLACDRGAASFQVESIR
jgi:hypothetical protein